VLLVANVLNLAGSSSGDANLISRVISTAFMTATTLYPVVYLYSIGRYIFLLKKGNYAGAESAVYVPYKTFASIIVLFILWMLV